jgi:hypothetical protein
MEKFEAPFLYGVTFYPNTASNYIINTIIPSFQEPGFIFVRVVSL